MKSSSIAQRIAIVGGGLAALAGSALLIQKTGLKQTLVKLLGLDAAPSGTPSARVFVHSGTTVIHPPPLPSNAPGAFNEGPRGPDLIWVKPGDTTSDETAINAVLTISRSELKELLKSAFPIHVAISADGEAWVEVTELDGIKYEPGHGIVLRCAARVNYPIPVLPDTFTLSEVAITVMPVIVEREGKTFMQFNVDVSELDLKFIPGFVDDVISDKINDAIRDKAHKIAWNVSKTLDRLIRFPERLSLLRGIELGPVRATMEVANEGLLVRCVLPVMLMHETSPMTVPPELPKEVLA